jgi:hypothetical protein
MWREVAEKSNGFYQNLFGIPFGRYFLVCSPFDDPRLQETALTILLLHTQFDAL